MTSQRRLKRKILRKHAPKKKKKMPREKMTAAKKKRVKLATRFIRFWTFVKLRDYYEKREKLNISLIHEEDGGARLVAEDVVIAAVERRLL